MTANHARLRDRFTFITRVDGDAEGHKALVVAALCSEGSAPPMPWLQQMEPDANSFVAIKIMKPEHRQNKRVLPRVYYDAFASEVRALHDLQVTEAVTPLLEYGYLAFPPHQLDSALASLNDSVYYPSQAVEEFEDEQGKAMEAGWLPLIVLGFVPYEASLLAQLRHDPPLQCWPSLVDRLRWAISLIRQLKTFHSNGYVFGDHKLEHIAIWGHRTAFIDWNGCFRLSRFHADQRQLHMANDLWDLFTTVILPMFSHRMRDGTRIKPLLRGFPGERQPLPLDIRGIVPLYDGERELSHEFQQLIRDHLQLPSESHHPDCESIAASLGDVLQRLLDHPAIQELEELLTEVAVIQVELGRLKAELTDKEPATGPDDEDLAALKAELLAIYRMRVLPDRNRYAGAVESAPWPS